MEIKIEAGLESKFTIFVCSVSIVSDPVSCVHTKLLLLLGSKGILWYQLIRHLYEYLMNMNKFDKIIGMAWHKY